MPRLSIRARRPHRTWLYAVGGALPLPGLCLATDVRVVAVTAGQSADVVIEHGAAVALEVGETVEGITLLRADRGGAVLRIDGITKRAYMGRGRGDSQVVPSSLIRIFL